MSTTADMVSTATGTSAILSMLHEPEHRNSATRHFRAEPVLSWTVRRLCRSARLANVAILCWEDQLPYVEEIAEEHHAFILAKGPRQPIAPIESIAAARRWSDGWRGGLLGTCHFDQGFYAPWVKELADRLESRAVLLVDPAAALVDPALVDELIDHAERHAAVELCFAPAAPGLAGALVRPALLDRLAASTSHPGRLLHYMPEAPARDPIGTDACVPVATAVARSPHSFRLDSDRQIARVSAASTGLNGTLFKSDAEQIVNRFTWTRDDVDALPREISIELTTTRRCRPVFAPTTHLELAREPIAPELWRTLFLEAGAAEDMRLTVGGAGDPLESDQLFAVIDAARECGIGAIHVQTDLLTDDLSRIRRLADSGIDVVSIHVPAMSAETYAAVMGTGPEQFRRALENVAHLVRFRHASGRGVPIVVPVFTKCAANLAEMEVWYDQWLKTVGCATIEGPSDFAGLIPDVSVADMAPPRRTPCARLRSRLHVLCDGTVVACDQDVIGRNPIGKLGQSTLTEMWTQRLAALRADHRCGSWGKHPACAACREWHRP